MRSKLIGADKTMNSQRLSRLIASRESQRATNYLLELYSRLSPRQRKIIRNDMNKLKTK